MKNADDVYRHLQRHLDKQAVGFPATKSGDNKLGASGKIRLIARLVLKK